MEAARRLDEWELTRELGVIERVEPYLEVRTQRGLYRASRAASCLVAPMPGDEVELVATSSGRVWVCTVLERSADAAPMPLRLEGDVELRASGALHLEAEQAVTVRSTKGVAITAGRFLLESLEARFVSERLGIVGGAARVHLEDVTTAVRYVSQVFERITSKVKRSFRFVEELDSTEAHEIHVRAQRSFRVRSENAFMYADKLVKVEGDQIHLG